MSQNRKVEFNNFKNLGALFSSSGGFSECQRPKGEKGESFDYFSLYYIILIMLGL